MATDEAGFRDFVDREYAPLVRALSLYCGDHAIAEELAQDAFARAYQRWNKVSVMARPGGWVRTVGFNLAGRTSAGAGPNAAPMPATGRRRRWSPSPSRPTP